jgi:hypothetical protein
MNFTPTSRLAAGRDSLGTRRHFWVEMTSEVALAIGAIH